jgi:hypothetical protein
MTIDIERRSWSRMTPGALGANLLILDEAHKRMMPAKLLDISAGGALIRSDEVMVTGGRLGLLIRDVPELGWIDAKVVRPGGQAEMGVRFISPFRPEFLLAATSEGSRAREDYASRETPYLGDAIPIW